MTKLQDLKKILADLGQTNFSDQDLKKELDKRLKITYIGHSLGGLTLFMYLINRKMNGQQHFLNHAILLSPAGFHSQSQLNLKFFNWLGAYILPWMSKSIAFPSVVIDVVQKLH